MAQEHPGQCVPRPAPPPGPLNGGAAVDQVEDFCCIRPSSSRTRCPIPTPCTTTTCGRSPKRTSGRCCCACLELYRPRWCCGTWTASRPRRSPACSMSPGRSWPGCIGVGRFEQELWAYAQETDSSQGDSAMTVKLAQSRARRRCGSCGTTSTRRLPRGPGEGRAAPVAPAAAAAGSWSSPAGLRGPRLPGVLHESPPHVKARLERFPTDL